LVPRLPMALLALGVGLLAFGSIFTGLILDTVTAVRREARRLHYLLAGGPRAEEARAAVHRITELSNASVDHD
jgi:hypothetical protein